MKKLNKKNKFEEGQAMVMLVLILGAMMLGASTIAGYVTLQNIKIAGDITNSTKAIYAADAGIEKCFDTRFGPNSTSTAECNFDEIQLSNGASFEVREVGDVIKSVGNSGKSFRAFGIFMGVFNR